jgi:GTPase SAR1 family protein
MENERQVSTQDGKALSQRLNFCNFVECSAKTNENINEVFFSLVRAINAWRAKHNIPAKKVKKSGFCMLL